MRTQSTAGAEQPTKGTALKTRVAVMLGQVQETIAGIQFLSTRFWAIWTLEKPVRAELVGVELAEIFQCAQRETNLAEETYRPRPSRQ